MKTRRIMATDIQAAMRELRRTMGPEAVILGTRELADGIEITAAVGIENSPVNTSAQSPKLRIASGLASLARPRGSRTQAKAQRTLGALDVLNISQDLESLGISSDVRQSLLGQLDTDVGEPWTNAPSLLAQAMLIDSANLLKKGGRVAILGPAGVGKTTTIAKIAAHFARRHGFGQVALINTDCYRIGASEQLRSYGRLMGVGVHQLQDSRGLGELLRRLENKRLVLIDTAGNSHEDSALTQQLLSPGTGLHPVQCYLAMSFNTQVAALEKSVRNFSRLSLQGTVLTKQDEAVSMGAALSIVLRHELPVAFVTTGMRVPIDIRLANAERLITNAFALMDKSVSKSRVIAPRVQRAEAQ